MKLTQSVNRIFISLSLVLLLTGCLGIKFTYNNLDWLVPWYLDDYLTLNRDQNHQFENSFERLWTWHRYQELPRYVALIQEIEQDVAEQGLTRKKLEQYRDNARSLYHTLATRAIKEMASLLSDLDDEQLEEIQQAIDTEKAEFREYIEELSDTGNTKKRIRNMEKELKRWLGPLTKEQEMLLLAWGTQTESTLELRYTYFSNSRAAFMRLMAQRHDKQNFLAALLDSFINRNQFQHPDYEKIMLQNQQAMDELILNIQSGSTAKQRNKLLRKLANYREAFRSLSSPEIK